MATQKFPFVAFGAGGGSRPLIPFSFPKNDLLCLLDSGASKSLINESIMKQQEIPYETEFRDEWAEGVCGKNFIQITGMTKPVLLKIRGFPKAFAMVFHVIADEHRLNQPIIGQDFYDQATVTFQKEGKNAYALISTNP